MSYSHTHIAMYIVTRIRHSLSYVIPIRELGSHGRALDCQSSRIKGTVVHSFLPPFRNLPLLFPKYHYTLALAPSCINIVYQTFKCYSVPANKEPFLNQLARVTLVHNWYRTTSMCFHVYSREYTCSANCHKF